MNAVASNSKNSSGRHILYLPLADVWKYPVMSFR